MIVRWTTAALLTLALALAGPAACDDGGDEGQPDAVDVVEGDAADADAEEDLTGRSVYTLTLTEPEGTRHVIERDITDDPTAFSFGSSHIAPAVAFGVEDHPGSTVVTFSFGKIVGSDERPVDTDGTGTWPFSSGPPSLSVNRLLQYRSTVEGATGEIVITEFGTETGEVIAGTVSGRLVLDADVEDRPWLDVEGTFHFTLPAKGQGQP